MPETDPDFIIIGAGAAGCTLAREILDRRLGSMLLVEAGSIPRSSRLRIPSDYLKTFGSPWDWNYRTLPQDRLGQRTIRWPAGRALGGSTSINAMIWIEPDARDFETWQGMAGPAWSLKHIETAFQRLREWLDASHLPTLPPLHPSMRRLLDASAERGWSAPCYPSGFDRPRIGIEAYRRMQSRGRRCSLWTLLEQEQHRLGSPIYPRLRILPDAKAMRLLFDGDKATGVRLASRNGEVIERRARRGVIVCSGTMETPRLLMASGLGPREELEWSGIACRTDLPELGENLQDHLVFPIVFRSDSPVSEQDRHRNARLQYARYRTGPRSSNLAELGGFFALSNTPDLWSDEARAEFQLHITPTHYLDPNPFGGRGEHVSFAVTPLHARSQGTLAIAKARGDWDPESPPPLAIDPQYLSVDSDRDGYLGAIEAVRDWIDRSEWQGWLGAEIFPKWKDRDRLASYVQRFTSTIYHYAGSCAMGTSATSCLNDSLQVRGVEGLWVCDASAMPRLVGCNPQASVAMMAVRLAEILAASL